MNNFIHKDYRFCVKVEYNNSIKNSAKKMIESLERHTVEHENQFVSGLPGMTAHAIKLTPEKSYNWHFDNCNWNFSKKKVVFTEHKRSWTHIIYLTEGAPLELGNFNFDEDISVDTMWSAPEPTEIIARINPQPGLGVIFPGFIAHRVHPDITGTRWCLVEFHTNLTYKDFYKSTYNKAKEIYFNEYSRRFGISP